MTIQGLEIEWGACFTKARSSGVEYLLDMQGVGGSKPPAPTDVHCIGLTH